MQVNLSCAEREGWGTVWEAYLWPNHWAGMGLWKAAEGEQQVL